MVRLEHLSTADQGLVGDGHISALTARDGWLRMPEPLVNLLVAPQKLWTSRQYYLPDTCVLVTEMRCPTGVVEVTDTFTLHSGADLAGDASAARGELLRYVRILEGHATLDIVIDPHPAVHVDQHGGGLRIRPESPGAELHLVSNPSLAGLRTTVEVEANEDLWFLLRWNQSFPRMRHVHPHRLLDETAAVWRRWSACINYQGPQAQAVRRSALTLKVAGPVKPDDAAGVAFALRQIGLIRDADRVLGGALDALEDIGDSVHQHGEFLDCAYQWAHNGGPMEEALWRRLVALTNAAGKPQSDTYFAAMCQVTLDRAAGLSNHLRLNGGNGWSLQAAALRKQILHEAWDETQQSLTTRLGTGGELDPRLLALPLRRVVPARHPRMAATANAIAQRLGLQPPYSFWLAENLLGQGRIDEAGQLYEDACRQADSLSLFSARTGQFPHSASHAAVIACGVALSRSFLAGAKQ